MIGQYVIVRTYTAGVHMGTLKECYGTAVTLENARRLWKWQGAFSLHEVSQNGVKATSNISDPVPTILLTQAIEVIPCSDKAKKLLDRSQNNNNGG